MFQIEQIRELIQLMTEHDITEISIKNGETEIELKRLGAATVVQTAMMPAAPAPAAAQPPAPAVPDQDAGLVPIRSPMVGTFYAATDPDSPPYVTIGSQIVEETVVCIVEAMKVFNEIKADVRGTVEKVMVSNLEGVDFGQPLFMVRRQ